MTAIVSITSAIHCFSNQKLLGLSRSTQRNGDIDQKFLVTQIGDCYSNRYHLYNSRRLRKGLLKFPPIFKRGRNGV